VKARGTDRQGEPDPTVDVVEDRVVTARGSSHELGLAHGEALRPLIHDAIDAWAMSEGEIAGFLGATDFLTPMQTHTPGLVSELEGIAEGAGLPFATVFAYNLLDEGWWWERRGRDILGCTVLALLDGGEARPVLAQNMDLGERNNGSQVVLRLTPDGGPAITVLSMAGCVGLTGANDAGVGVCVNTLPMLRHRASGLPVAAVLRGALSRRSRPEAAAFVRSVPHAAGQNYAIGDGAGLTDLEADANGVSEVSFEEGRFAHTNHPLESPSVEKADAEGVVNSKRRLTRARERLANAKTAADLALVLEDRDAPICATGEGGRWTFGSILMTLGAPPRVRIALGPPDRTAWLDVSPA
jgi:isopenicillin-N N-acyltransferase like protein